MTIEFYKTNVYGNETMYIKDEELKQVVRRISGRITLKETDIIAFEKLGIQFVEVKK
jgi:hypothetical protein